MYFLANKDAPEICPDSFSSAAPAMFSTIEDALLCVKYLNIVGSCYNYEIGTYSRGKYIRVKSNEYPDVDMEKVKQQIEEAEKESLEIEAKYRDKALKYYEYNKKQKELRKKLIGSL